MRIQTRINGEFIEEMLWTLKWKSLNELNDAMRARYRLGKGYMYRLAGPEKLNTTLNTVDAIYNVMADRFIEVGLPIPDNLWCNLLAHEFISDPAPAERSGTHD